MTRWYLVVLLALSGWLASTAVGQGPFGPPPPGFVPGPPNPGAFNGGGFGPDYTTQLVPDIYDQFSAANRQALNFTQPFSGAWVRADYLLWGIEGPGNQLVGAPMATLDPNSAFSAFDPINGIRLDANGLPVVAIVPNLGGTQLRNQNGSIVGISTDNRAAFTLSPKADTSQNNGVRISAGVPLYEGSFEAEAWALQEAESSVGFAPRVLTLSGTTLIPALTLLDNGLPSDSTMILFSNGYQTTLTSNLWGTEGNYVFPTQTPGSGLEVTPLLGFRYSRFGEKLGISGTDVPDPINDPGTILNHRINAAMSNHVFGPQVGLRTQLNTPFFTLGFEPKLAASVNRVTQQVQTQQIYSTTELPRNVQDEFTEFSPTLDLSFYAKVRVTENFSINVGYDYIFTGSVYRAFDNIAYNSPVTAGDPPTIGLQKDRSNMYVHGLMVGGEYVFR